MSLVTLAERADAHRHIQFENDRRTAGGPNVEYPVKAHDMVIVVGGSVQEKVMLVAATHSRHRSELTRLTSAKRTLV